MCAAGVNVKPLLIAYYSRTGHTRRIANEIARRCDADLEDLQLSLDRAGWRGYVKSVVDVLTRDTPSLGPLEHSVADYPLVVIGSPVWALHIASPLRSYLQNARGSIRNVACFCTMGGRGAARAFGELNALVGRPLVATLALTDAEIEAHQHVAKLGAFVDRLRVSLSPVEEHLATTLR